MSDRDKSGGRIVDNGAPRFGRNVGDGLRKSPAVAGEVFGRVLAFAVRIVCGRTKEFSAELFCAFVVCVDIGDVNVNQVCDLIGAWGSHCGSVCRGEALASPAFTEHHAAAVADGKLGVAIAGVQAFFETECAREPIGGAGYVVIYEVRDDGACWC